MALQELRYIYEKRKNMLSSMLSRNDKLTRSRKEQLAGAIAEIDALLKTIDSLRQQEIEDNTKLDAKSPLLPAVPASQGIFKSMKAKFSDSRTKHNLMNVFVRKCETRTKYEFYSQLAKNEGYEHIAHVFSEMAQHEREHAKLIFKHLGWVKGTKENIKDAADVEREYHKNLYEDFENTARQENLTEIAEFFHNLGMIEAEHEKRFLAIMRSLNEKRVFSSEHIVKWRCRNCGHIAEARDAPKRCIVCKQNQAFFEVHKDA